MSGDPPDEVHEDIENPDAPEPVREARGGSRSALTRWVAERQLRNQPVAGAPSYVRCQERGCWGKATWTCPTCGQQACSAHRPEHRCSPYLPR